MKDNTVITIKEWFFDKLNDQMLNYHCMIVGEYENGRLDHTKLRVSEVLAETEKAYKVSIEAETQSGRPKTWTAWLPKSVIVEDKKPATYEDLRQMVMSADSHKAIAKAEQALKEADLDIEQYDELMSALTYISRELYRIA